MNVEHSVDTTGWKTTFQTQMRVKTNELEKGMFKHPNIYMSTNWLTKVGVHPIVRDMFKDFNLDSRTGNGVVVFTAKGRKNGVFNPEDSFNITFTDSKLRFSSQVTTNNPGVFNDVNVILQNKFDASKYTIAIVAGGAFAWETGDDEGKIRILKDELRIYIGAEDVIDQFSTSGF